jgi:hypothetical protein
MSQRELRNGTVEFEGGLSEESDTSSDIEISQKAQPTEIELEARPSTKPPSETDSNIESLSDPAKANQDSQCMSQLELMLAKLIQLAAVTKFQVHLFPFVNLLAVLSLKNDVCVVTSIISAYTSINKSCTRTTV